MTETIIDTYFGNLDVSQNKKTGIYFLAKKIEIPGVHEVITLRIESDDMMSSTRQQETFDLILFNFTLIYKNVLLFLTKNEQYHVDDLPRHYRVGSITLLIQSEPTYGQWLMDITDLKEGSALITVEMVDLNPINFSVKSEMNEK